MSRRERSLLAIHLTLTTILLGIAAVLAWPDPTFPTSLAYTAFSRIANEESWAMAFGLVGVVGVAGLCPRWRLWAPEWLPAAILAATHGTVALLSLVGSPTGWGWVVWSCIAGLGWFLAWETAHAD